MNINLGSQIHGSEKFQERSTAKTSVDSKEAFQEVLNKVAGNALTTQAVTAMEGAEQTRFNRKKERIEKGEGRTDKEKEESVYKKMHRLVDNLRLVALFEKHTKKKP